MKHIRKIGKIIRGKPVVERAGVHLKRVFGFHEVSGFDPFLLLDDFRSANREEYIKGFPWHPHRGIETITYVLTGDVKRGDIPEVVLENGIRVRVICGCVNGVPGPVRDIVIDPEYLDVIMPPGSEFVHPVKDGHTLFAYVIGGEGFFDAEKKFSVDDGSLVLFDDGDQMAASTGNGSVRFLLVSGKPIGEPVAWRGPIVMNTQEELRIAF